MCLIDFGEVSKAEFLAHYWRKKPLLIKQALPGFSSPISPDELAGFSLDNEIESRLIQGNSDSNEWSLESGPFDEARFANLADRDWTLLIQGVDRVDDDIYQLIQHFDFIPRWRFDDVMISYAATGGSVGPHFDHYDVFLLQGSGRRRWQLSSKHCEMDNTLADVPLRIMQTFEAEMSFEVEPGDVLYIPPKVAHHGVSLDDQCTTLSFGYRSYSGLELFGDQCPQDLQAQYYQDPVWSTDNPPGLIPDSAIEQAREMAPISDQEFAKLVTKLDMLDQQHLQAFEFDNQDASFNAQATYQLHPSCKVAYLASGQCFINGEVFMPVEDIESMHNLCNTRLIDAGKSSALAAQLFAQNLIEIRAEY